MFFHVLDVNTFCNCLIAISYPNMFTIMHDKECVYVFQMIQLRFDLPEKRNKV